MPTPKEIELALAKVKDQPTFIKDLLIDTLDWPIAGRIDSIEEITYQWSGEDLRADLDRKLDALQIANLDPNQPWGIFILQFRNPEALSAERGITGTLRTVLRGLVPSRRKDAGLASWNRKNLLFICTHDYTQFRFAYFKDPLSSEGKPRLATFGWHQGSTATRTVCEFNLSQLTWPENTANTDRWISHWASAFDVEKVTKKFYADYAAEDKRLRQIIAPLLHEKNVEAEPVKMFVQTLLNRLMFLRFIERKGWLHPPRYEGEKDYLRRLFDAGNYRGKSFYTGRLRKLFFEGLAVEGKQESEAIGKVPFLNGGLFERKELDDAIENISNEAFAPLLGPEGLFYRFNFTAQESTPLDVEVAVDPEMLGKVFEELVTGRHESGSYYTPRPVVSYMCREGIKGYLAKATRLDDTALAAFVDKHDTTSINIAAARAIAAALDNLKAVDPACGSGAYLLGLLHEMVDLYKLLYSEKLKNDDRSLHVLKLQIISHSIYGVDIDRFATNIAMLRLWLSLAVDSSQALPLPNLEFKIETGDSLTGPDPSAMPDLFREKLQRDSDALVRIKDDYLNCHDQTKHAKLAEIQLKQELIAKALQSAVGPGVIDWRIHFAEVFAGRGARATLDGRFAFANTVRGAQRSFTEGQEPGGFDIVLANPPYIRQELIKDIKPVLKKVYADAFSGTADLYVFFYLRALQLLAPGGMLVVISSNKWFRAGYGQKLRSLMARQASVRTILDFHDLPVFESAIAYPMIFVAAKRNPQSGSRPPILAEPPTLEPPYPDVTAVVSKFGQPVAANAFGIDGTWRLTASTVAVDMDKMLAAGPPLNEFVGGQIYNGVKTGLNVAFVIGDAEREQLLNEDPGAIEYILPYIEGDDIKRWVVRTGTKWLIYLRWTDVVDKRSSITKHLKRHEAQLHGRDGVKDDGPCPWFALSRPRPEAFSFIKREKIIFPDIAPRPRFTLDRSHGVVANTAYIIPSSDLFLLGVLNSRPVEIYYINAGAQVRGGYLRFIRQYVEKIPIPNASAAARSVIGTLAQKCLDAHGIDCEVWEREIDERVAALYGIELDYKTVRPTPIDSIKGHLQERVIPKLATAIPHFPYFTLESVHEELKKHRGAKKDKSVNQYLYELIDEGAIFDAGRGWYSTLREPFVLDRERVRPLVESLEQKFPLLEFSCWSTQQVAPYGHHMAARFCQFVYTDRDAVVSVADALRAMGKMVYADPESSDLEKHIRLTDGAVIVRPSISQAPVDGKYATIEKILVDLYVEAESLRLMDGAEYGRILENVISQRRVSIGKMIRYATRRNGPPIVLNWAK